MVSPTPFAAAADVPARALPALLQAEREAARGSDWALLAHLWAEESRIVDRRSTPDPADDYIWAGRAALLDRYVVAVFPNPPPPLTLPADLPFQVIGDRATLQNGIDRWTFVYQAGRWWLAELVYN
jgi:hypothetical protein